MGNVYKIILTYKQLVITIDSPINIKYVFTKCKDVLE